MNKIAEICCGSYDDALNAFKAGAKRIELNSALYLGGLTPSLATLIKTKTNTDLEVICMVRNRGAGFNYNDNEIKIMMDDAKILLENGADGIAFGFLNSDRSINTEATKQMIDLIHSYNKTAVFHRAIDVTYDYESSFKILCELHCDRILTSGKHNKALDGIQHIRKMQDIYGKQIQILAGSGINESNAEYILSNTGINQIHSSCKDYMIDHTTGTSSVSYAYISENKYEIVSEEKVKLLLDSIK